MNWSIQRLCMCALGFGLATAAGLAADTAPAKSQKADTLVLPSPSEVKVLETQPTTMQLIGADASRQLVITGNTGSRLQDLTGNVRYEVSDANVARVSPSGHVIPLANGSTTIHVSYGDKTATVAVKVQSMDENLPINFENHVVPIFTKLGCNGGGCHGKSGGQNGFALSLLGFVPEFDYQALVKENRGRRLLPAAPEHSLLLLKASGTMAHGGGKRLEPGSDEYKLIRRWIAAGSPVGSPSDPTIVKITIFPEQRLISRNNRQQFAVLAHYSDGSTVDVTQRAQYESNDPDIAVVDGAGLVRSLDMSGEAAIMARYQAQVAVFRATVPLGKQIPVYAFEPKTVVDRLVQKKWQELGIVPSPRCSDEQFIRRVSLDITGTLPTPKQIIDFLANPDPKKRDKLIDVLLETSEYSYFFANRWADVLRVKRGSQNNNQGRAFGTFAFHNWIRESIAQDKPYDQFVREILAAVGDEAKTPPAMWYRDLQKPEQFVDDASQVFLGVRMGCAQCHHHPYEKWSQDDYWGMAAFFGQLGRKVVPVPGSNNQGQQAQRQVIFNKGSGNVINTRTKKAAPIKALDGDEVTLAPGEDPRQRLVDWMVDPANPFFARSVANRYWAHFFGRGIVDPLDDMRVTNPPSNPELLDALAKELIDSKFSLKQLIRTITRSQAYQLSAVPNEFNQHDKKAYARFYPRRLTAEVLYDAVSQVTAAPPSFAGLPTDKFSPNRAIMLPDEAFQSYFLDVFGRPQRISACECERVAEANLAQALHMLNSQEIQAKLSRPGGRADMFAKDKRRHDEKVDELFLWALGRHPTASQRDLALANISRHLKDARPAYENIIWALINTKEFILVQ
jgi:hypothetical protein